MPPEPQHFTPPPKRPQVLLSLIASLFDVSIGTVPATDRVVIGSAHVYKRCWCLLLLLLLALPAGASAQLTTLCTSENPREARQCEKSADKQARIERRQQIEREIQAYRDAHPWRISALAQLEVFVLGLGHAYGAGYGGGSVGASLLRELTPHLAWRLDALARFGRGRISNWDLAHGGPISEVVGFLVGAELASSLMIRMGGMYIGPVLSLGVLHLNGQTLHEADFADEEERDEYTLTVRVPNNAAFLAGGLMLGGEVRPNGAVGGNARLSIGVWDDFQHPYLHLSFTLVVRLWD